MEARKKACKVEASEETFPKWKHLPKPFLHKLAIFVELLSPSDKLSFLLVCKSWCNAYKLTRNRTGLKRVIVHNLPCKLRKLPSCFLVNGKPSIYFVATCVFLVQPLNKPDIKPWLVSVEELNPGKLKIHSPLTKTPIRHFPLNFPTRMDLSGFRVVSIHRGVKVCYEDGCEDVLKVQHKHPWGDLPARNKVVLVSGDDEDDWVVAIVLVISESGSLMSFSRKGGRRNVLAFNRNRCFDDVVCFKGFVYVINRAGRLYSIDVDDDEANIGKLIAKGPCKGRPTNNRKRLMVLNGELCMINRYDKKLVVYKLNEGLRTWDEVNSLGDCIVLVTLDDVFEVNASEFPRCRGDCILFAKHCFPDYSGQCSFENKVFSGENKFLEVGVYYMGEDSSFLISRYPDLCDMLSPFPSWICSSASSTASEVVEQQSNPSRLTALISSREVPVFPDVPSSSNAPTLPELVGSKVSGIPEQTRDNNVQAFNSVEFRKGDSSSKTVPATRLELPKKPVPESIDLDSVPDVNSPMQKLENAVLLKKFEGVNVEARFMDVLQTLHKKHGYIIEGSVNDVQRESLLLKGSLETLAQMVMRLMNLQSNPGRTLSDTDTKFLDASVEDLKFMHSMRFNVKVVDWLATVVRSALDQHRENSNLTREVEELEAERLKRADELHELEKQLKAKKMLATPRLFLDLQKELMNP